MEFKLIIKKINNNLTDGEKEVFDAWYRESLAHRDYFQRVKDNYWEGIDVVDIERGWKLVSNKITPKKRNIQYWKYAAAIAALFLLASIPFLTKDKTKWSIGNDTAIVKSNTIFIGTDKAILTLGDGSDVALDKSQSYTSPNVSSNGGELVYTKESKDSVTAIVYNELTVPRGGQFTISLADGTKVWLNSESKLRYPIAFDSNTPRTVELIYGEAYFDVSASTENYGTHFIVEQKDQKIEVLGTEFNIKAYRENVLISTTLVEGKVMLTNDVASKDLLPGQQATLNTLTKKVNVEEVDVFNEISWKNGLFSFKDKSLEEIMTVLSRWYDVDVAFKNEDIKKLMFNGVFRKSQSIDEILTTIENTNEVKYTINQKTITME